LFAEALLKGDASVMKEVTKEKFKEVYLKLGGGAETGWSLEYWNKFYEDTKKPGMKYLLEEPATPEHTRMFIVDDVNEYRLFFLTEESEESFFAFPEPNLSKERQGPRRPEASDFPPNSVFVIKEFDLPLVAIPNTAKGKSAVSWFNWYGGEPRPYDPSFLTPDNNWNADSFEEWVKIVKASIKDNRWKLQGYDTLDGDYYPLDGDFTTEAEAIAAAKARLAELELEQPTRSSGGQDGIQDRVFVVRPDGTMFRVRD